MKERPTLSVIFRVHKVLHLTCILIKAAGHPKRQVMRMGQFTGRHSIKKLALKSKVGERKVGGKIVLIWNSMMIK